MAAKPKFKTLPLIKGAAGEVVAIGATNRDGIFIAAVAGAGLCYLDSSGATCHWAATVKFTEFSGAISTLGLHYHRASGANVAYVSFAETARSWICLKLPAASELCNETENPSEAELVRRAELKDEMVASSSAPEDGAVSLAFMGGAVSFFDATTGQLAAKSAKLGRPGVAAAAALARIAAHRVVLVRSTATPGSVEVFLVALHAEAQRCEVERSSTVSATSPLDSVTLGTLVGATMADTAPGGERVLLCWSVASTTGADSTSGGYAFASMDIHSQEFKMAPLLLDAQGEGPPAVAWACVNGYLAVWAPRSPGGGADNGDDDSASLQLSVRDVRYGMPVASGLVPFTRKGSKALVAGHKLLATARGTSILLATSSSSKATVAATVQWSLPSFTLRTLIATNAAVSVSDKSSLEPLRESLCSKRSRQDPSVVALFSAKRRKLTDEVLASELKERLWRPSHELLDIVLENGCWATAGALFGLPELDDALAVRLLVAQPGLLLKVIKRLHSSRRLSAALRDHYPAKQLPELIEALLELLKARREWSEGELQEAVPGFPSVKEVLSFLNALTDGCLASLSSLDQGLIERAMEMIVLTHVDHRKAVALHAIVREGCRIRKPPKASTDGQQVEVMLLPV